MCTTHINARYTGCSHPNHSQYPSIHYKHHQTTAAADPKAEPGSAENPIYSTTSKFMGGICGVQWVNMRIEGWCMNCQWVAHGAIGLEKGFVMGIL
ncbi:hypothetical protein LTR36_008473 [Oleoguttula mirabilis]|uniref:Uncharacterized protein n=1 Tax=Oleoguttula mirabilis TaxID=1507867 RepID=A0AAV9J7R4_9PEZI|nr:hypothetical protein LTR36_008473 [Oleoguttula mirabilis]